MLELLHLYFTGERGEKADRKQAAGLEKFKEKKATYFEGSAADW
jgi:hypothetical protein